jgi:hypothetical protein
MADAFTLPDSQALDDLATYLGRASRIEDGSVRLIGGGGVLAVYVAVLYPSGLLDESPTILGLRTFAIAERDSFDAVVPVASLLMRIASAKTMVTDDSAAVTLTLPMQVNTVTWAAISPPRGGWTRLDPISSDLLNRVGRSGIEEVAAAIPTGTGEQIVRRVRNEVWGRPIRGAAEHPAGVGFAAVTLGFLPPVDEQLAVFETGAWSRVSSNRGHVLVKRRAWSLSR